MLTWYLLSVIILGYLIPHIFSCAIFGQIFAYHVVGRVGPLRQMITALVLTLPQLSAILTVFSLFSYVFAVFLTQIFKDQYEEEFYEEYGNDINYFGRLDYSLLTLFLLMAIDNWNEVIVFDGKFTALKGPLVIFMLVSTLVLLNLVVAVLCSALARLRSLYYDKDTKMKFKYDEVFATTLNQDMLILKDALHSMVEENLDATRAIAKMLPSFMDGVNLTDPKLLSLAGTSMHNGGVEISGSMRNKIGAPSQDDGRPTLDGVMRMYDGANRNIFEQSTEYEDESTRQFTSLKATTLYMLDEMHAIAKQTSSEGLYGAYIATRRRVATAVLSDKFQTGVIFFIVINSLTMGIATFDFIYDNEEGTAIFDEIDNIFLIIFTIEFVVEFFVHGLATFRDGWLGESSSS